MSINLKKLLEVRGDKDIDFLCFVCETEEGEEIDINIGAIRLPSLGFQLAEVANSVSLKNIPPEQVFDPITGLQSVTPVIVPNAIRAISRPATGEIALHLEDPRGRKLLVVFQRKQAQNLLDLLLRPESQDETDGRIQ